jgi:FimV-like protein
VLIRSLGIAITIATLWWPSSGFSLGLGDINVKSTLASPLEASIPLNGMERIDLDPGQFFIRIDSNSHQKIQYRLERTDTNSATIILYTRKAVKEPLFQFRLEVEWDKGIIGRRYDVFIDPPSYQSNPPTGETLETVSEPIATNLADISSELEPNIIDSDNRAIEPGSSGRYSRQQYGPVLNGDSVWRVAINVSTGNKELSIYQWMYGIWKENPQAFSRSNMHRIKMGELINVPFEREIEEISHSEAYQTYTRHLAEMEPANQDRETALDDNAVPDAVVESILETGNEKLAYEQLPVTADEEPAIITRFGNIERVESPAVSNSSNSPDVEVLNQAEVILGLLKSLDTEEQSRNIIAEAGTATGVPAVQSSSKPNDSVQSDVNDQPQTAGFSTLKSRNKLVEQLPVIGSQAPLAFVGRSLNRADQFISGSPSWTTLALGIWVTMVLVTLWREIRSRPGLFRNLKQKSGVPVAGDSASEDSTQGSVDTVDAVDNQSTEYELDGIAESSSKYLDVDEIIAAANIYRTNGRIDEAVNLLESRMELQADEIKLRIHLLELYQKAGAAEAFKTLVEQLKAIIAEIDTSEQYDLQEMYSELCPDSTPLIDMGHIDGEPGDGVDTAVKATDEAADDDDFLATQIIFPANNEAALTGETETTAKPTDNGDEQDDTLKEVDVYLAYGLYDNAEELLTENMKVRPGRADYTSKLLDTYFATKNVTDFTTHAEALKGMGKAANRYWDRVQVMGYELAPSNKLFSGAKNSSLNSSDLSIAKPEAADFDLSLVNEDETPFAEADFLLIEDADDLIDVDSQSFNESVTSEIEIDGDDEGDEEIPIIEKVLDDLNDLESAIDADDGESIESDADKVETLEFDLPDIIDMGDGDTELQYQPDASEEEITSESKEVSMESTGTEEIDFEQLTAAISFDDEDGFEELLPVLDKDEIVELSRTEEVDIEQLVSALNTDEDEEELVDNMLDNPGEGKSSKPSDRRILHFPESRREEEIPSESESEVSTTLQAIRDQMQQMSERLFSQEQSSDELKKAIDELNDLSDFQLSEKSKESK